MFKRRVKQARAARATPSQSAVRLDPLRPMPLERTIAWGPALVGDARPSRPSAPGQIFITPNALRDVRAQMYRDGAGSLGYFVGERFRDADSKEPWVLVEAVIPVAKQPTRTPIGLLLDATFELARAQARAVRRHVVGWYHSAECSQPVLTAADTDAHERHFAKTHSFMLMVAIGRRERQAALFRPSLERGPVPFYELLEEDSTLEGGARSTAVSWPNYFTVDSVARESPTRVSGSQWATVRPPALTAEAAPPEPVEESPAADATSGRQPVVPAARRPEPTRQAVRKDDVEVATAEQRGGATAPPERRATQPRAPVADSSAGERATSQTGTPQSPLAKRTPTARPRVSGATPAPVIMSDPESGAKAKDEGPAVPEPLPNPSAAGPEAPPPAAPPAEVPTSTPQTPVAPTEIRPPPAIRQLAEPASEAAPAPHPRLTEPGRPTRVAESDPFLEAWQATPGAAPLPPFRIIDPAAFDKNDYRWWQVRAKLRPFLFGGLGLAAVLALVALGSEYTPALWPLRTKPPPVQRTEPRALSWAADAVRSAVTRYRGASILFDGGRIDCEELGRYLISIDQAWITYSVERAAMVEPLDAVGVERERRLESDVAGIERHFRATRCARP